MYRTHTCGELNIKDIGKTTSLCGWVSKIRDKGHIVWVDLRDMYGITQLKFPKPSTDGLIQKAPLTHMAVAKEASAHTINDGKVHYNSKTLQEKAKSLGREFVIKVQGEVIERESKNKKIATGDIEILVHDLEIINTSETPPFIIEDDTDGSEELRMRYRYLDIRRSIVKNNLLLRHKIITIFRNTLNTQGFTEVETPTLIKSTPEGARDFLVPSRMNKGKFYALPQSPQTLKQLLMVGGVDKYYQIARCFRDEDLRSDRQPEFSQIDCEMAFVDRDDILNLFEKVVKQVFSITKNVSLPKFDMMLYGDVMSTYGTDKPDLRFNMPIVDITNKAKKCDFKLFESSEKICGICVKGGANFSRKQIDSYTEFIKNPAVGGKGLIYIKYNEDGTIKSSIDKHIMSQQMQFWFDDFKAKKGDIMFIVTTDIPGFKVNEILGKLRVKIAKDLNLINSKKYIPLWVLDFPMFEQDKESGRLSAAHHPFTSPKEEDLSFLMTDYTKIKAKSYDLVINGHEIAGGSIRIHKEDIQRRIFHAIGMSDDEINEEFGFLMRALKYGAPPHGGIAFGVARLCAILGYSEQIRDFIAFPKNNAGRDVMIDSPSYVSNTQLGEIGLT